MSARKQRGVLRGQVRNAFAAVFGLASPEGAEGGEGEEEAAGAGGATLVPLEPDAAAEALEEALHEAHPFLDDQSKRKAYVAQFRSLRFNLEKNTLLKSRVLRGAITPTALCAMSAEEMADE